MINVNGLLVWVESEVEEVGGDVTALMYDGDNISAKNLSVTGRVLSKGTSNIVGGQTYETYLKRLMLDPSDIYAKEAVQAMNSQYVGSMANVNVGDIVLFSYVARITAREEHQEIEWQGKNLVVVPFDQVVAVVNRGGDYFGLNGYCLVSRKKDASKIVACDVEHLENEDGKAVLIAPYCPANTVELCHLIAAGKEPPMPEIASTILFNPSHRFEFEYKYFAKLEDKDGVPIFALKRANILSSF
jgi:hypothetical protein